MRELRKLRGTALSTGLLLHEQPLLQKQQVPCVRSPLSVSNWKQPGLSAPI